MKARQHALPDEREAGANEETNETQTMVHLYRLPERRL